MVVNKDNMYTYACLFFFGHSSSCSHLHPKRRVGWAQSDRWGHTLPEVWARSVQCVTRGKPKIIILAFGTDKANPRVSATSSIVRAYKGYAVFYGIVPFARVPDPELT